MFKPQNLFYELSREGYFLILLIVLCFIMNSTLAEVALETNSYFIFTYFSYIYVHNYHFIYLKTIK